MRRPNPHAHGWATGNQRAAWACVRSWAHVRARCVTSCARPTSHPVASARATRHIPLAASSLQAREAAHTLNVRWEVCHIWRTPNTPWRPLGWPTRYRPGLPLQVRAQPRAWFGSFFKEGGGVEEEGGDSGVRRVVLIDMSGQEIDGRRQEGTHIVAFALGSLGGKLER